MSRQDNPSGEVVQKYLRVLGLRLGATLEELKKAYRMKALHCHPDRQLKTDGGAEFKVVQAAYEYFHSNPSALSTPLFPSNHAREGTGDHARGKPSNGFAPGERPFTPCFTEEELFGRGNDFGDFGVRSKKPGKRGETYLNRYSNGTAPSRQTDPNAKAEQNARSPFEEDSIDKIMRDREAARANRRTPLDRTDGSRSQRGTSSGADEPAEDEDGLKGSTFPPPPHPRGTRNSTGKSAQEILNDILQQHRVYDEMPCSRTTSPFVPQEAKRSSSKKPGKDGESATQSSGSSLPPLHPRGDKHSGASTPQPTSDREFPRGRDDSEETLEASRTRDRMDREARRKKLEEETKREWADIVERMEGERQRESVEKAMRAATTRVEQSADIDRALRAIAADRRKAKAEELSRLFPSTRTITAMSETDLHLLQSTLRERLQHVERAIASKATDPCVLCATSSRWLGGRFAGCTHRIVCELCYEVCLECPVCGAQKPSHGDTF